MGFVLKRAHCNMRLLVFRLQLRVGHSIIFVLSLHVFLLFVPKFLLQFSKHAKGSNTNATPLHGL